MTRVTVFGTGYLGAVHAACLAAMGWRVLGVDTDEQRVAALRAGRPAIHESGLPDLLHRGLASGRLSFTTSYRQAAAFGDVHFLCVGTPQHPSGGADLSQVDGCLAALTPLLTRPCLVVGRSTVPVGTAARLASFVARRAPVGAGAELAWNPEFLREGHAVADTLAPDRIVVGATSAGATDTLRTLYARPLAAGVPFIATDPATAEMAKAAANAFLATKISFINAMSEMCAASGADVVRLAEVLGADGRIGSLGLRPGVGFGGGCLPKDLRALVDRAGELGVGSAVAFLREVDTLNMRQRHRAVELAMSLIAGRGPGRVGVLGLAFKAGSDDIRDSPALHVAAALADRGVTVTGYDPAAMDKARAERPQLRYAGSAIEAARDADVLLVLTDWPEFDAVDPMRLGGVVARRTVIDGRHVLDPARWRDAGWDYHAFGRPGWLAAAPAVRSVA